MISQKISKITPCQFSAFRILLPRRSAKCIVGSSPLLCVVVVKVLEVSKFYCIWIKKSFCELWILSEVVLSSCHISTVLFSRPVLLVIIHAATLVTLLSCKRFLDIDHWSWNFDETRESQRVYVVSARPKRNAHVCLNAADLSTGCVNLLSSYSLHLMNDQNVVAEAWPHVDRQRSWQLRQCYCPFIIVFLYKETFWQWKRGTHLKLQSHTVSKLCRSWCTFLCSVAVKFHKLLYTYLYLCN